MLIPVVGPTGVATELRVTPSDRKRRAALAVFTVVHRQLIEDHQVELKVERAEQIRALVRLPYLVQKRLGLDTHFRYVLPHTVYQYGQSGAQRSLIRPPPPLYRRDGKVAVSGRPELPPYLPVERSLWLVDPRPDLVGLAPRNLGIEDQELAGLPNP